MYNAKTISCPLGGQFRLSSYQSPPLNEEKDEMSKVLYASAVGSLMYAMIRTRSDIAHAVEVVSKFLANPGREHWSAVKGILKYLRGTSKSSLSFGYGEAKI